MMYPKKNNSRLARPLLDDNEERKARADRNARGDVREGRTGRQHTQTNARTSVHAAMSRLNPSTGNKGVYAPPPSSAAIASAVSSYMASIETRSPTAKSHQQSTATTATAASSTPRGRKAKQKLKLKQNAYASLSIDAAAAAQLQNPGANFCRNPFCGAQLESRFAKYCVRKSYCQLYRGLQLHCGSFAIERERAVDEALDNLREAKRRRLRKSAQDDDSELEEERRATAKEKTKDSFAEFSIPKRKIPIVSSTSKLSKEERRAQKKLQRRMARQEEAAASVSEAQAAVSVESSDTEQSNGRKRRLILNLRGDNSSNSSSTAAATAPPLPPTPVATPSAQAKTTGTPFRPSTPTKVGGIEVIPLGAGRHPSSFGGGSRYVQSGNRTAVDNLRVINPLARQPTAVSAAKPPLPAEPAPPLPPVAPSSRSESMDPRFQARTSASATVVPTPRATSTDPRRTDYSRSDMTPASSPVLGQESQAPQPAAATSNRVTPPTTAKRIISASEYMSSRKPQDARVRTTPGGGDGPTLSSSASLQCSSSELSNTPVSSSYLNGAPPPSRERTFSRSQSDSDVLRSFATTGSRDSESLSRHQLHQSAASTPNGSRIPVRQPSTEPLYSRSSSYDGSSSAASSYARREYNSRDNGTSFSFERPPPLPSRPYSPDKYHDLSYEPDYHHPSSSSSSSSLYPQDQQRQRRQDDSISHRSDEPPSRPPPLYHPSSSRDPGLSSPPSQSHLKTEYSVERVSVSTSSEQRRDVNVHPEILPVAFSSHDRFIVNLLSRFASFFPKALAPVLNKTKKPRKMRFYLDYVERVKQLAGCRLDIQVADGKGVVTVEGREWLVLKGQSTVDLYTQILETLLEQGTAWKKLIDDSNRVYSHAVKRVGSRGLGERSESFLRMWRGMKVKIWKDFPTERQVTYFRGSKRHHWSFCVGNVEIGSGSHEEKNEALRLAGDASMKFLLSLEILSEREKYSGGESRRYESMDRDSDSSSQQRSSSTRDPLPSRATRSSINNNSSSAVPQVERSSTTASRPSPPVVVAEIVETPDVTVTRVRDDSFSSNADGAFSPVTQSDHSVTEEDMEISDADGIWDALDGREPSMIAWWMTMTDCVTLYAT